MRKWRLEDENIQEMERVKCEVLWGTVEWKPPKTVLGFGATGLYSDVTLTAFCAAFSKNSKMLWNSHEFES